MKTRPMKVALVHDFLMQMGGAEKVLEVLHGMFPDAPVYTSAYDPAVMPDPYRAWDIRTTFLQRLPWKKRTHRLALLLYPLAFETLDLTGYDLVISSSSCFAKGVVTSPDALHLCYTHTPMRFAWGSREYLARERGRGRWQGLLAPGLHYLRLWDAATAGRVDQYVANSSIVARRIRKFYGRDSRVIHPPVDTARYQIASDIGDYYMIASRFIPYKRLDLAVEAFTRLGRPLKIVGDGRQRGELARQAGPNVEFLGRVSDTELARLLARAKAYVMPGEEDFGIAPVEANACGRPVIAYAAGGALDSQVDGETGVLFEEQTVDSLCAAVHRADAIEFDPQLIQAHARLFDTEMFQEQMLQVIADCLGHAPALPTPAPQAALDDLPLPRRTSYPAASPVQPQPVR